MRKSWGFAPKKVQNFLCLNRFLCKTFTPGRMKFLEDTVSFFEALKGDNYRKFFFPCGTIDGWKKGKSSCIILEKFGLKKVTPIVC
ncbi:MAG: hypothetical protein CM15mP4_2670 [Candidatus Neomarinimicrobiota bacterium]|nr:MAG: hypothetical protein CM15mP4_2670 [Candidatus Neomarinimicrobiota bacterium]